MNCDGESVHGNIPCWIRRCSPPKDGLEADRDRGSGGGTTEAASDGRLKYQVRSMEASVRRRVNAAAPVEPILMLMMGGIRRFKRFN